MPKSRIVVTGGKRLRRHLRAKAREIANPTALEVGFLDKRMAALAATQEFGLLDGETRIPSRPAFRRGIPSANAAVRAAMKRAGAMPSQAEIDLAGQAATEAIKGSYMQAPGPDLSDRQAARKQGTPGEDKLLIGHRGPRLIDHIRARLLKGPLND